MTVPSSERSHALAEIVKSQGMCGDLAPDGSRVCILTPDHEELHPWASSERTADADMVRVALIHTDPADYAAMRGAGDALDRLAARLSLAERQAREAREALKNGVVVASQYFDTERGDLDGWIDRARAVLAGSADDPTGEARKTLIRAAYLVDHLVQQVPEFTGVVGPGGESEDDYIRGQLHEEAEQWRALACRARSET